jgi:hypothetical protein
MKLKKKDKELLKKKQRLKPILLNHKILLREQKKLKLLQLLSKKRQKIQLQNGKSKQQMQRKKLQQIC